MGGRYDPHLHHRHSIRLKEWDYASPGVYFITICTFQRQNLFDHLPFCQLAQERWQHIPAEPHAVHVTLDEWIVMPNHIHGILVINNTAVQHQPPPTPLPIASPLRSAPAGSLGALVGQYKSGVTRRINNLRHTPGGRIWQRGYYERLIRNEREWNATRQYIRDNPARWAEDRENLDRLLSRMTLIR
jgi:putative transposase